MNDELKACQCGPVGFGGHDENCPRGKSGSHLERSLQTLMSRNTRPEPAADDALVEQAPAWLENLALEVAHAHTEPTALTRPTGEYERGREDAAKVADEAGQEYTGLREGVLFDRLAKRIRNLKGQP